MERSKYTGKIAVIGAGNIGATVAYSLLMNKLCNEIAIVDIAKDKASGEALDMQHATSFSNPVMIRDGDYTECADADLIVVTAGIPRKPGQTRIELAQVNVAVARDIAGNIKENSVNPLIVVVTNPVDVITYVIRKELGLSPDRCIGTGTSLDTARLRYACAAQLKMDVRDMNVYMCGEHGDTMFPVWSCASVGGAPLKDLLESSGANCEEILARTVDGGAEIIRKKGATVYGIASATTKIVSAIMNNENAVLSLSRVQENEFMGVSDVALSLPYVINRTGIVNSLPIAMNDSEKESFVASADKLKSVISEVVK